MDSLSEIKIQEKLKKFECQRCNECCKKPGFVYLKDGEAEQIANRLELNVYDFTQEYCEVVERRHLVLKKQQDERCVFLNDEGCTIHGVKPEQCRNFPFTWRTKQSFDYCEGLKKIF